MGVEMLPKDCSPLDPGVGLGDTLRLSPFAWIATQIFQQTRHVKSGVLLHQH
jgi:hypothetical protein